MAGHPRPAAPSRYPRRVRRLLTAAALAAGLAASPAAAAVDELSTDPLDRGTLLALPSVYRVQTEVEVPALRTRSGELFRLPPGGRRIQEVGTAFAVAPGGVLVTAAHVAAPTGRSLAFSAAPIALAARGADHSEQYLSRWVVRNDVRPVGARVLSVRVWPAVPDAEGAPARPRMLVARVMRGGIDRDDDLALLRTADRGIPALLLDDATTVDTPIATLGYGDDRPLADRSQGPPVPTVRRGVLGPKVVVETLPSPLLTFVTAPVAKGDSGGPAVDALGHVRGVVRLEHTLSDTGQRGGIIEQASRVRLLLDRVGVRNEEGATAQAFRAGMTRLWALDPDGAARDLRRTVALDPGHALAPRAQARADALARAGFRLAPEGWNRGLLLGAALASALASAACLALLAGGTARPSAGARRRATERRGTSV